MRNETTALMKSPSGNFVPLIVNPTDEKSGAPTTAARNGVTRSFTSAVPTAPYAAYIWRASASSSTSRTTGWARSTGRRRSDPARLASFRRACEECRRFGAGERERDRFLDTSRTGAACGVAGHYGSYREDLRA